MPGRSHGQEVLKLMAHLCRVRRPSERMANHIGDFILNNNLFFNIPFRSQMLFLCIYLTVFNCNCCNELLFAIGVTN